MDFFSILTLLGGLALFLYGMQVMGDGLAKVSGGKLEQILENLTSSKWKAVLLGLCVTAVIQSSSATTVMVVGFVNSGIMKLTQAVGIIMGANIGTTVTSWLLSLTGIESSNFFISLLKPSSFSPVLAMVGIILLTFTKSSRKKDIGTILLGFAVLMFGMESMSGAVKPLADVPEFTGLLLKFSNPVAGILAGAILTAIIQSSSASVGILQALCMTGAVPFSAAFPIIMGQNIGTCVTALLSAIGANKNAKRAAMIHLYFNLIGTVIFMALFYLINTAVHFSFMTQMATPATIAITHSIFNITATVVWLPFSGLLVKLACLTIRDDEHDVVSREDQELKLKVRDAVGHYMKDQMKEVTNRKEAEETANANLKKIEKVAEDVIAKEGRSYTVNAFIGPVDFPVKTYGAYSFPAGTYEAVEVVIGEGAGKNWWCVMYPNMCFQGSMYEVIDEKAETSLQEVLTQEEYDSIIEDSDYKIQFKYLSFLNHYL